MDQFEQKNEELPATPAAPVTSGPDITQESAPVEAQSAEESTETVKADQVNDDTPGVDDSAPSLNEEDNE